MCFLLGLEVGKLLATFLWWGDSEWFFLVVIKVACVSRTFPLRYKWSLHLQRYNSTTVKNKATYKVTFKQTKYSSVAQQVLCCQRISETSIAALTTMGQAFKHENQNNGLPQKFKLYLHIWFEGSVNLNFFKTYYNLLLLILP